MSDEFVNDGCCYDRRDACEKLVQVKLDSLYNIFETKLEATDTARNLAAEVLSERLKSLNELRQMASDRDALFVTKDTFAAQVINIENLRLSEAKLAGKADQSAVNISYLIATIGLVIGIIGIALHFIR